MKIKYSKTIVMVFMIITFIFIAMSGITFAYFNILTSGNDTTSENNFGAALYRMTLNGTSQMSFNAYPGESTSTTFTVTNSGSKELTSYVLYLSDIQNTFIKPEEVVYTLTCSTSSGTCSSVSETTFPVTSKILITQNTIPVGATDTYVLKITYKDMGSSQTYNEGKTLKYKVRLNEVNEYIAQYLIDKYSSNSMLKVTQSATGNQNYITNEYRYQGDANNYCDLDMTSSICSSLGGTGYSDTYKTCENGGTKIYTASLSSSNCSTYGGTYITGVAPNNYVSFNDESWKIVGVFQVDNGSGLIENRVKIIKSISIGTYALTLGNSVNDWSQSILLKLLNPGYEAESINNSLYYNRTSGTCQAFNTTTCNFTSTGFTSTANSMIDSAKWYLGGSSASINYLDVINIYNAERSNNVYTADSLSRNKTWVGKVALLNASDLIYASKKCYNAPRYNTLSCYLSNWLPDSNSGSIFTTITPSLLFPYYFYRLDPANGGLTVSGWNSEQHIFPTTYLKSTVKITGGSGTAANPYTISL